MFDRIEEFMGQGVRGTVCGYVVMAGNHRMLDAQEIEIPDQMAQREQEYLAQGSTLVHVTLDGAYAGMLVLTDTLRAESGTMVEQLMNLSVPPMLLTGDNEQAVGSIAGQVGIRKYYASCMPEDKIGYIKEYQDMGETICMIGDGINDAPALKMADVGIAMGGIGSDITVDAADIVLVDDDVKELPHLFALSQHMMHVIRANLAFSMGLNFLAVALAVTGILDPVWGALVHNAGSIFVIVNSSFLLAGGRGDIVIHICCHVGRS